MREVAEKRGIGGFPHALDVRAAIQLRLEHPLDRALLPFLGRDLPLRRIAQFVIPAKAGTPRNK